MQIKAYTISRARHMAHTYLNFTLHCQSVKYWKLLSIQYIYKKLKTITDVKGPTLKNETEKRIAKKKTLIHKILNKHICTILKIFQIAIIFSCDYIIPMKKRDCELLTFSVWQKNFTETPLQPFIKSSDETILMNKYYRWYQRNCFMMLWKCYSVLMQRSLQSKWEEFICHCECVGRRSLGGFQSMKNRGQELPFSDRKKNKPRLLKKSFTLEQSFSNHISPTSGFRRQG